MSEDTEIDVEQLRTELDQIKDAMGIQERYEGSASVWLMFGLLVPVASACSQYVFMERLPPWLHTVVWVGVLGGGYALWSLFSDEMREMDVNPDGKPNLWLQFGLVFLAVYPIVFVLQQFTGDLGYVDSALVWQSVILVMIGVAYGILGSSMAAYYVRWRDRAVFYVGTVWMVLLGVAIPMVPVLQRWPYAAFGATYFVYAMGAYAVLVRT